MKANLILLGPDGKKSGKMGQKDCILLYTGFDVVRFLPDSTALSSPNPHAFQINFNSLYTTLCEQQNSDHATLLLYSLLHQNSNVRTYMLARTDMENLVNILSCVQLIKYKNVTGSLAHERLAFELLRERGARTCE